MIFLYLVIYIIFLIYVGSIFLRSLENKKKGSITLWYKKDGTNEWHSYFNTKDGKYETVYIDGIEIFKRKI